MEAGDDGVLRLLREGAPVRDADLGSDPRVGEALADLHARLVGARVPRRRSRLVSGLGDGFGRLGVVLAVAAATALVPMGVAGIHAVGGGGGHAQGLSGVAPSASAAPSAQVVPLHTGIFGDQRLPGDRQPGEWADGSEWLNLASPAMPGFVRGITAGLPLAPGTDWGTAERALTQSGRRLQESAVIVSLRSYQLCTWARAWDPRSDSETAPKKVTDAARFRFSVMVKDGKTSNVAMSLIPDPLTASRVEAYVSERCGTKWTVQGKLW